MSVIVGRAPLRGGGGLSLQVVRGGGGGERVARVLHVAHRPVAPGDEAGLGRGPSLLDALRPAAGARGGRQARDGAWVTRRVQRRHLCPVISISRPWVAIVRFLTKTATAKRPRDTLANIRHAVQRGHHDIREDDAQHHQT